MKPTLLNRLTRKVMTMCFDPALCMKRTLLKDSLTNAIRAEVTATFPEMPGDDVSLSDTNYDDLLAYAEACARWRAQFNA